MNYVQVDQEIRNDILEYFPTILDRQLYYQIAAMVEVNFSRVDAFLKESSCTKKWKVPLTTLKRLDDAEHDWSTRLSTLHQLPNVFLEPNNLFLDCTMSINHWDWKEKSKRFPLVSTVGHQTSPSPIEAEKKKVKMNVNVAEVLALMDATCILQQQKGIEQIGKKHLLGQEYGIEINVKEDKPMVPSSCFLPKKDLDDFKMIQDCLLTSNRVSSQEKKRVCELDNTRLKFD